MMDTLTIEGKTIQLYAARQKDSPLVILHTVQDEGESVYKAVLRETKVPFSFAAIGGIHWNAEMSPWPIPPISRGDTPCTGGADEYLHHLTDSILPKILLRIQEKPKYIALAGYSLAGLFAIYALYHTNIFSRIASASGSFWYPDFMNYVEENQMKGSPHCIYFSLGDKEASTRNKILRPVEKNTRRLQEIYSATGIRSTLEMNPGNHFQNATERMARGIVWILQESNPE